jgi:hypothetical protein
MTWTMAQRHEHLPRPQHLRRYILTHDRVATGKDWPGGRIVFDRSRDLFILYADRKPLTPATIARIKTQFQLPAERTEVNSDFHYQSNETPNVLDKIQSDTPTGQDKRRRVCLPAASGQKRLALCCASHSDFYDPLDHSVRCLPFHDQFARVHAIIGNYILELIEREFSEPRAQGRLSLTGQVNRIEDGRRASLCSSRRLDLRCAKLEANSFLYPSCKLWIPFCLIGDNTNEVLQRFLQFHVQAPTLAMISLASAEI